METLRVSAVAEATGVMLVTVYRGAVTCWRASEVSCATKAWDDVGSDGKERVNATVA